MRYFDKTGDRYAIKKALKELVHFDFHNLKTEYLPQRNDVIFCRNVMMYFDEPEQKRLLEKFARCLNLQGYLFVGPRRKPAGPDRQIRHGPSQQRDRLSEGRGDGMTQFSDERGAEMRELFFETAQELLQSLNEEALKLEKNPGDAELVRSIRRIVHTLKGDAAACGFRELSNAAHDLEDALALESASSHGSLAEVAFTAADTFGAMLAAYRRKGKLPSTAPLAKMIRELLAASPKAKGKARDRRKRRAKAAARSLPLDRVREAGDPECGSRGARMFTTSRPPSIRTALMPIAARQLVLNALKPSAEVLGARPEAGHRPAPKRLELLVASEQVSRTVDALMPHSHCDFPSQRGTHRREPHRDRKLSRRKPEGKSRQRRRRLVSERASPESGEEHRGPASPIIRCSRKTFCVWMPSASTACSTWWGN